MRGGWTVLWSSQSRAYTGVELRPHFLLETFGLRGSGVVGFRGPCRVETQNLIDWEDRLAGETIQAREMIHFVGEFFGITLREAVLWQRLWVATAANLLEQQVAGLRVFRKGNDLFVDHRKLSVSIVTATPVSKLFHLGVNIDPAGAPVPAVGLKDWALDPAAWANQLLEQMSDEVRSAEQACVKVRSVV